MRSSALLPQHASALLHYLRLEQAKPEHAALLLGIYVQRSLHSVRAGDLLAAGGLADH